MTWLLIVVCVVPAILRGLSASIFHFVFNNRSRRCALPWSMKRQPTLKDRQSHLSQHTGVVRINVTLRGILSCYESSITSELLSWVADARFTGCISLYAPPICICTKWNTSVYVKVISEQLKFAQLPRSTLCGPRRWNNKSTYRCQLTLLWAKLTQFTFPSHTVCLGFITILLTYWRFLRGNSDRINNDFKVVTRIAIFSLH